MLRAWRGDPHMEAVAGALGAPKTPRQTTRRP